MKPEDIKEQELSEEQLDEATGGHTDGSQNRGGDLQNRGGDLQNRGGDLQNRGNGLNQNRTPGSGNAPGR